MEQHEKLTRFETAVFAEVDTKVAQIARETEQEQQDALLKNQEEEVRRSTEEVRKCTQDIQRKYKREVAKFSLEMKRCVLQKRSDLSALLFFDVEKLLVEFRASEEYISDLLSRISDFSAMHRLENVHLLIGSSDMKYFARIKEAYALPCELEEDPQNLLGGFAVRDGVNGVFFDETLARKLAEQKNLFTERDGFSLA